MRVLRRPYAGIPIRAVVVGTDSPPFALVVRLAVIESHQRSQDPQTQDSVDRAVPSFLIRPSTAFLSCISRIAQQSPIAVGAVQSFQASIDRAGETNARTARWGMTLRSGSGWACTGFVVGIAEFAGLVVNGMMLLAAAT